MEMNAMSQLTIGKAAAHTGVGVETIRFYERIGLIEQPPTPPGSGFRRYPPATIQRVRFIRQAQEIGFSLREISELLALRADPSADHGQVRTQAGLKLEEVNRKFQQRQSMQGAREVLMAACPGRGALRTCSIMDALTKTQGQENLK